MRDPIIIAAQKSIDARGSALTIPFLGTNREPIYNVHIVTLFPQAVRGNHYHTEMEEGVFTLGGLLRFYYAAIENPKEQHECIIGPTPTLIKIPLYLAHAFENIDTIELSLVCFSYTSNASPDDKCIFRLKY